MDTNLEAVNLGVDVRGTLESRDWNKEAPWKVLRNRHRWSILKTLKPERKTLVRALAAKRIKRDPSRPNVMDPLKVIKEMSASFAVDPSLAALCMQRLCEEFKKGRYEEELTTWLHPVTKTLNAVREHLNDASLWKTEIAEEINRLALELLKSSPGFYELEPVMLMHLPDASFNRVLDALKLVADNEQAQNIWIQMYEAEAPACIEQIRKELEQRFPDAYFVDFA